MGFFRFIIKLLIILAMIALPAIPLIVEYLSFRRDRKKGISFKRFRLLIFAITYTIILTLVIRLLGELGQWIGGLSFVQWIAGKIAVSDRFAYGTDVFGAILANAAIGGGFLILQAVVKIGLKKKDLVNKKEGRYTLRQRIERAVIRFFHHETWYFVGRILKWFTLALSIAYGLLFLFFEIPIVFGADWIPYEFISMLFGAGYLYPVLTLIPLWEIYYFLEGIRRIDAECPEIFDPLSGESKSMKVDYDKIDAEGRKNYENFYAGEGKVGATKNSELASSNHSNTSIYIGLAVQNDVRHPRTVKETYLNCVDHLAASEQSILLNGSFFSEFSAYFLRYLAIIAARGDNIVFVCSNNAQIRQVYNALVQGFKEITSLYSTLWDEKMKKKVEDPIWRIEKICDGWTDQQAAKVNECSILVTSLNYLCSDDFEANRGSFVHLLDTVVYVDVSVAVNAYRSQMSILDTRLRQLFRVNAERAKNKGENPEFKVPYLLRQIRYFCFDPTRTPGMDRVLANMLSVEIDTVDAMRSGAEVMIRCYNYEGRPNGEGDVPMHQYFPTGERIGIVMNMAFGCLAKGAGNVTIFDDDTTPYEDYHESLKANLANMQGGTALVNESSLRLNEYYANPEDYSVIIAVDSHDNLPVAIRRYASMVSDKPAMLIIFSRPYLFRDYYMQNIDKPWVGTQLLRIPVENSIKKDIDVAQKILVMANAGGITESELLGLAHNVPRFNGKGVNEVLRAILDIYGKQSSKLYNYFEYKTLRGFDANGKFCVQNRILLREEGTLYDILDGCSMVLLVKEHETVQLPVPKGRLSQNYILDQNLIYDGAIYNIHRIDLQEGKIFVHRATSGMNIAAYRYVQARHYRVEQEHAETVVRPKNVLLTRSAEGVSVREVVVSAFRAPTEVLTDGFFTVDPAQMTVDYTSYMPCNDFSAKQTYRVYGAFEKPTYDPSIINKDVPDWYAKSSRGALMMSVCMKGQFGTDGKKTVALAAAMLNEILHTMFPSVADSVAVCPVLQEGFDDEESHQVMKTLPRVTVLGPSAAAPPADDILELLIIEDSDVELGVVSALIASGDDVMYTLFAPILEYLNWYTKSDEKSRYLYYGLDHEPACFDFAALHALSGLFGTESQKTKFQDLDEFVIESDSCDFCGKSCPKGSNGIVELDDGRHMCRDCAANLVGNNKKILKEHLERAKIFLENTYGITLDDDYEFCFESTVKIAAALKNDPKLAGRGTDVPMQSYIRGKKVYVEDSIPSVSLAELLVRELTYIWQLRHVPDVEEKLAEGHIALVALQYLRFLNQKSLATIRSNYYESSNSSSGVGYRKLVHALLTNPQYRNNPFLYLLKLSGDEGEIEDIEETVKKPVPVIVEEGEYGRSYTPEKPDRCPDGNITYFHYTRLTPSRRKVYDAMLDGIRAHAEKVPVDSGTTNDDVREVSYAILYDRPELFYFKIGALGGSEAYLYYGADADEADALMAQMEPTIAGYLEGIDDSMSAYDVAVRLHTRVIKSVDYDSIALNEQKARGGPGMDEIDYLRTICGVFLNGKVVCEGYARAMAYLLQRCGVECAECVGDVYEVNGEKNVPHAWNILKIDGDYYHLDVTWDDRSNTIQQVKNPHFAFDYFCITTEEMSRTRNFNGNPCEIPECTATRANYHTHNDLVLDRYDADAIAKIAADAAESGRSLFTVKFSSKKEFDVAMERIFNDAADLYAALKQASKKNKKIADDSWDDWTYNKELRTITITFKFK